MKVLYNIISVLTNFCLGNAVGYLILGITVAIISTLLVTILVSLIVKKMLNYSALKYMLSALIILNVALTILEMIFKGEIFKNVTETVIFNVVLISVILLVAALLVVISQTNSTPKNKAKSTKETNAIESVSASFNEDLHEAITAIPAPDESMKKKIIDTVQTGYMINDKVLRHAKVVVGQ